MKSTFFVIFLCAFAFICEINAEINSEESFSTKETSTAESEKITLSAYPGDCTKYILCEGKDCRTFECGRTWKKSVFDPVTNICVFPNNHPNRSFCGHPPAILL